MLRFYQTWNVNKVSFETENDVHEKKQKNDEMR